ncbi:MAG: hypothetical protein FWG10_12045 [Eubacteriaceae bacterium]|nr:hypothetical protein [Eubacteriaceae bacterium]
MGNRHPSELKEWRSKLGSDEKNGKYLQCLPYLPSASDVLVDGLQLLRDYDILAFIMIGKVRTIREWTM